MSYDFNADDIFDMAEQIERNGAKFYRTAADGIDDSSSQKFLLELAAMEDEHEKTFASIRSQLSQTEKGSTVFDPENEAAICKTLGALRGNLTILAISHQPAILKVAERAYRLEDGKAVLVSNLLTNGTQEADTSAATG